MWPRATQVKILKKPKFDITKLTLAPLVALSPPLSPTGAPKVSRAQILIILTTAPYYARVP